MARTQTAADDEYITLAAETMAGDLRDFVLDRLRHDHNPIPWNLRAETAQRELIEETELACRRLVQQACVMIAAGGQQAARGDLIRLQAKDGVQLLVKVGASDPLRHELMDRVGGPILLVLSNADDFAGERGAVRITPDQGSILEDADG